MNTTYLLHALALGWIFVAVMMAVLWLIHLRLGNAAVVDAGWAAGLALLAVFYAARFGGARASLIAGLAALWGLAVAGESMANAANLGRVSDVGLWRYSRHPNYFFECLIWVAHALYATTAPWGWLGWLSPAIILFLLFRVTGIPETEAQALRSRGDAYRRYQQTTSVFVPWFPRRVAS